MKEEGWAHGQRRIQPGVSDRPDISALKIKLKILAILDIILEKLEITQKGE